jgi:hypothetical protein
MVAAVPFALEIAYGARLVYLWRCGRGDVTPIREIQSQTPHTAGSDSYALIPQTTNDIHFSVTKADSDRNSRLVNPPFIK